MKNLIELLANIRNSSKGITFYTSTGTSEFYSYQYLYLSSQSRLQHFNQNNIDSSFQAVFQISSDKNFIESLWACILGGITVVPLPLADSKESEQKLRNILDLLDNPIILSDSDAIIEDYDAIDVSETFVESEIEIEFKPQNPLLIQFSSGSTGSPKGVIVSHENLISNLESMRTSLEFREDEVFLSWAPLTHSSGMILSHLNAVRGDYNQIQIERQAFISNPLNWIYLTDKHNATFIFSPNFGYKYLLSALDKKVNYKWDLSSVRYIMNGSEQISAEIANEFTNTLSQYGLNPSAMTTIYGLAENTLAVSCESIYEELQYLNVNRNSINLGGSIEVSKDDKNSLKVVSQGKAVANTQIRIFDEEVLSENMVGEIQVRSDSVISSYYKNPTATESLLTPDAWLKTGDLGFLREGRLYVCGRQKELIIINGINYYPDDIERQLASLIDISQNHIIVSSKINETSGTEEIVCGVASERDLDVESIKKNFIAKYGIVISHIRKIESIPTTSNGKKQRIKFAKDFIIEHNKTDNNISTNDLDLWQIRDAIIKVAEKFVEGNFDSNKNFALQGFNSIKTVEFVSDLSKILNINLDVFVVFNNPDVQSLSNYVSSKMSYLEAKKDISEDQNYEDIAIIGIDCRFPKAKNADEFYRNLINQTDCISQIPKSRWDVSKIADSKIKEIPNFGGFLSDFDLFDNEFFNILPIEAKSLDPQQRLLLETTIHALEDANIKIENIRNSDCGVYVGIANSDYAAVEAKSSELQKITPYSFTGYTPSTAAGRISYFLGLHGPNLAIDTACSSSLAALHYASRGIQNKECKLAIVSGVNLILSPEMNIGLYEMGVLSEDGRCKTFDKKANGYVRSEGCATLIIKSLKQAEEDGDRVYGVVKASALSHDGASNGLTAPNGVAQVKVMQKSLGIAKLHAKDINYFEAHGTGTVVGDLQELNSISEVCGKIEPHQKVGAVKSNIGHTEAAAGLAGVIKILKSYEKSTLPGNLHFNHLPENSHVDISDSNIVSKNIDISELLSEANSDKLRASINSFGYSGTNVNLILEQYPNANIKTKVTHSSNAIRVLPLTAKTSESLDKTMQAYSELLNKEAIHIDDLIANLELFRDKYNQRLAIVSTNANIHEILADPTSSKNKYKVLKTDNIIKSKGIVFTYPGGGAQRLKMGQELMYKDSVFADNMLKCDKLLANYLNISIIDIINTDKEKLGKLEFAQPALFAIEYSLSQMFISYGITPQAVIGHSTGEYAAACIAGIISLEDAVKMISVRAKLMDSIDTKGKMVAVYTNSETVGKYLTDYQKYVSIATINSSENVVISGSSEKVDEIVQKIKADGIEFKELKISQASHSPIMEEIIEPYREAIKDIEFKEAKIDYYNNITGKKLEKGTILDAEYWCNHILECVNFAASLRNVRDEGYHIFLELGPSPVLSGVGLQDYPDDLFISAFAKDFDEYEQIQRVLGELYVNGIDLSFSKIYKIEQFNKIELPKYQFSQKRFYQDPNHGLYKQNNQIYQTVTSIPEQVKMKTSRNYKNEILEIIVDKTGLEKEQFDINTGFFQMGMDSLTLVKMRQEINKKYAISVSMTDLVKNYNTVLKLSEFVKNNMPDEPEVIETYSSSPAQVQQSYQQITANPNATYVESIIQQQMQIMQQQLNLLQNSVQVISEPVQQKKVKKQSKPTNFRSLKLDGDNLSVEQEEFINDLIEKYNHKTKSSMEYAQKHRKHLCDWINTLSFRFSLKKMSYPFVSSRSEGGYVWDLDGNKYIDIANGYGVHFFGHRPKFVEEAILQQIEKGFELGPQSAIVGETAELIARLSKNERVTFCNTGSEAIMVAIRVARAKTGRDEIVLFGGSYHGTFDGVLAVPDDDGDSRPVSIGVPEGMVENVKVLDYGSDEALEYIKINSQNIAAVICEPVQSRKPHLQPKEFIKELREITQNSGTTLIFDEVVNGFRISVGGAQEFYGIKADLVTYGKVIGGGMPLGVLAGKAEFLDYIDGGNWDFADNSVPKNDIIFFGGTFCKHPLTMAACNAVLKKIEKEGDELYTRLNSMTADFADKANKLFKELRVPLTCTYFASQFRIDGLNEYSLLLKPIELDIFFYLMIYKGVYFWERKVNFLSTETSTEDVEYILKAMREALTEMIDNGFFPDETRKISPIKIMEASTSQKRMFLLSQYEGGEIAYHITLPFLVKGKLETNKLEAAISKIVDRHEILRTKFYLRDSKIISEVVDNYDFKLIHFELEDDLQIGINTFIQSFDLSSLPLFRFGLAKINENEHLLVLDIHHIIFDGLSIAVLIDELCKFYVGEEVDYQPTQFNNFLELEKRYFKSKDFQIDKEYWLENLKDLPVAADLPYDFSRPPKTTFEGDQLHFQIDSELTTKIFKYSREKGITLNTVLLSAYALMLNKLSGAEDFVIGCPASVRAIDDDLDTAIGLMANTVPHRIKLDKIQKFSEFAQKQAIQTTENYEHSIYPIEKIIEDLALENYGNRHPLFDSLFIFEAADSRLFDIEGLSFERYKYQKQTTMSDLVFEAIKESGVINCSIEYDKNLFEKATIQRFIVYYNNILSQIISDNDVSIQDVNIIPEKEYQILKSGLMDYNHEAKLESALDIFAKNVANNPYKKAVITSDKTILYKDLDKLSNSIAYHIQNNINTTDAKVALLLDRKEYLIAAILACYKLGVPYIPLDKSTPQERNEYILQDSMADLLITEDDMKISIPQLHLSGIDSSEDHIVEYNSDLNSLAYITYTSGSTGKPKGVIIRQENIVAFVDNFDKIFNYGPDEKILAVTTVSFDISNLEIICSLLYGMTVVLASDAEINNLNLLKELCHINHIENIQLTPSRCNLIYQELGKPFLTSFKTILVGGEAMPKSLYNELKKFKNTRVINVYGPTETTIWSSSKLINHSELNIGRALVGEKIFILDQFNNPVPIGVKGEICIAGSGVGNGYYNREDLTNDRFIKAEFTDEIIYKTGDIGRINNNLEVEIFGRNDNQIKIRGYRVELEEIENIANSISGVQSAVCKLEKDSTLAMFYIGSITEQELKKELRDKLPAYMLPAYFTKVENFPQTPNGKINRKALKSEIKKEKIEYLDKQLNNKESKFVEILKEVLGLDSTISLDSDYFEIGGDSIKSIKLISSLYKEGIEVDFKTLFTADSIAEIIQKATFKDNIKDDNEIEISDMLDLLPMQEGMLFESLGKDKSIYHEQLSFSLQGDLDFKRYKNAWNKVLGHFDIFKSTLQTDENYKYKRKINNHMTGKGFISENSDFEVLKRNDLVNNFSIENGELYRLYLNKRNDITDVIFSYHHLILDGWSLTILFDLIRKLYKNPEYDISEIPDTYSQISQKIIKNNASVSIQDATQSLLGLENLKETKLCIQSNEMLENIESVSTTLNVVTLDKLKDYATKQKVSLQSILLGAWTKQLSMQNGSDTACFALSISGRNYSYPDIDKAVGLLMNTLPMKINTDNNINTSIKEVHAKLASVLDYQHISLAEIIANFDNKNIYDHIIVIENYQPTDLSVSDSVKVENIDFYENTDTPAVVYFSIEDGINIRINSKTADKASLEAFLESYKSQLLAITGDNKDKGLPEKDISKQVISLFEKILEVKNLSLNSDFFDFGGHSLKIIRLLTAMYKEFNFKMEVEELYKNPTPIKIASLIEKASNTDLSVTQEIYPLPPQEKYDLSYAQRRLWLFAERFPENTSYNVVGNLIFEGDLDINAFEKTIRTILEINPIFRIAIDNEGGMPSQRIMANDFVLKVNEFENKKEIEEYVESFSRTEMQLNKGNLFRIELIKLNHSKYIFLFNAHHIIFDGWSNDLLLKQIQTIYRDIVKGQAIDIQTGSINYFDYAHWYNQGVMNGKFHSQKLYWQNQLQDIQEISILKGDISADINIPSQSIYKELKLNELIISRRYSKFTLLTAAVTILMAAYENRDKIIIGIPVSGRSPEIELSDVMGYFINTLPLVVDIEKESGLENYLEEITEKISQLNSNQSYPLELLNELNQGDEITLNKLFNVIVNSFDSNLDNLKLDNINISEYPVKANQSKYDLQFYFEEKEEVKLLIEYSSSVYSSKFIDKMTQKLETTLNMMQVSQIKVKDILNSISEQASYKQEDFLSDIDNIDEEF